ncbi:MAG TPA: hypothetical protein IAB98_05525 [Candidatus Egerieimonas intestinavium]|uniref:Uncharacterized protein n=1 Tax=Candidatus Egerieimonas intestinavium TaxID=2840777 RepID=A0A9D1EIZ6_9FIRM|nr:hypothetical protein [Candidatus Egerieimonas intestinavium]
MKGLLLSETYAVLLSNAAGDADLCQPQYGAGVILGGISDLQEARCIAVGSDGRLGAANPLPAECAGLSSLYRAIEDFSKDILEWVDYYCCSPTGRNIRRLLEDLYESLEEKGMGETKIRKGLLGQRRRFTFYSERAAGVQEQFLRKVISQQWDSSTVFCLQMLQLAGVLKKLFPTGQRPCFKEALEQCRYMEEWKSREAYVNRIKNFVFQNTVNSGAMYS